MKRPVVGVIKQRLTSQMFFWKLTSMFFVLKILLKVAPPSKEQLEEMLIALEKLKIKLGEVD